MGQFLSGYAKQDLPPNSSDEYRLGSGLAFSSPLDELARIPLASLMAFGTMYRARQGEKAWETPFKDIGAIGTKKRQPIVTYGKNLNLKEFSDKYNPKTGTGAMWSKEKLSRVGPGGTKLGEVLPSHPKMYERVPEMEDITLVYNPKHPYFSKKGMEDAVQFWDADTNSIVTKIKPTVQDLNTGEHMIDPAWETGVFEEIQHGINTKDLRLTSPNVNKMEIDYQAFKAMNNGELTPEQYKLVKDETARYYNEMNEIIAQRVSDRRGMSQAQLDTHAPFYDVTPDRAKATNWLGNYLLKADSLRVNPKPSLSKNPFMEIK